MPPSISSRCPGCSRARMARVLASTSGMNDWPEKPGLTLITRTMSNCSTHGRTRSSGVGGLIAMPADMPASRIAAIVSAGSPSASTWKVK